MQPGAYLGVGSQEEHSAGSELITTCVLANKPFILPMGAKTQLLLKEQSSETPDYRHSIPLPSALQGSKYFIPIFCSYVVT